VLEQDTAADGKSVAWLGKTRHGHSIVVYVPLPLQSVCGSNNDFCRFDTSVVSFAGAQEQSVRQQGYGVPELVSGNVLYL
jgi:hypothetical protein